MLLRAIPPLALDLGIAVMAGVYITKLKSSKSGFRLPQAGICIAHRGAALDVPENTMAAFKYCVEKGCKYIELDVRITKDGVPIVCHDEKIQGNLISTTTWDQIKDIQVGRGHPMEDKYSDVTMCTLEEALNYLNSKSVHTLIDMKSWDMRICAAIARHFSQCPAMYEKSMISAFNPLAIYRVRKLNSKIVAGLAYHPRCFSSYSYSANGPKKYRYPDNMLKHSFARLLDKLHSVLWWTNILPLWTGCSIVLLHKDIASLWSICKWQQRGYKVALWTVNQPAEKRMITKQFGVPYITDTLVGEDLMNGFVK